MTSLTAYWLELITSINGNLVARWHCQEECDLETASLALAISAASTFNVPRQSIHLVWAALGTMPPDDSAADTSPAHMANVELVLEPLKTATDAEDDGDARCQCCADPCDDADHAPWVPRARVDNCVRCVPCFLCVACRLQIPSGGWVCFECLEPADRRFLNTIQ